MKSALDTLSRIKKFELDEQQRLLVAEQEKEDKLNNELKLLISKYLISPLILLFIDSDESPLLSILFFLVSSLAFK